MNRIDLTLALAAGIACAAFGYEPQRHNDTFTTNGITYAQRGGLCASDYVVTNVNISVPPPVKLPQKWALSNVTNANGETVNASDVGAVSISRSPDYDKTFDWSPSGVDGNIRLFGTFYKTGIGLGLWSGGGSLFNYHDDTSDIYQFPAGESGTLALKEHISANNQTFSNAVLAVGLNIDTNSVAVINEIAKTFGGFPIEGAATTVGGLLAALAAAVAWMNKNKLDKTAVVAPSASATVGKAADAKAVNDALEMKAPSNITTAYDDKIRIVYGDNVWWIVPLGIYYWNDGEAGEHAHSPTAVFALPTSAQDSSLALTSDIDARLPYPFNAVPSTGLLKDRALNTTSLASVTVPDNFTDLLIRASVASSLSVTMPGAIATKYGDAFPGEAGEYLITITKTGAAEAYVRTIKLEVANA